jgi:[acyl-carrier-protein] S-malonyltransferase
MGKIAFVFSGQGGQYSGMGKELYDCSPAAKRVFDIAEKQRYGTSEQCFNGSKETLSITINTQPCLYCVDLAAAEALKEAGILPDAVAGFSLGEIAALTYAGVFTYEDGFSFVCKRAELMHIAAEKSSSAMAAVLKLDNETVIKLCLQHDVYPVNFNCPGQLVVAGKKESFGKFGEAVADAGGRMIPLAVSGGFHSPFMNEASDRLRMELISFEVFMPKLPVYANYSAEPYESDINNIKNLIARQVNNPVLWQKTIEKMIEDGIDTFVEVGAGKTLCGLIKKINQSVNIYNVEDVQSLRNTLAALGRKI